MPYFRAFGGMSMPILEYNAKKPTEDLMAAWQWLGFGVTTLLGPILHFLYDFLGGSFLIAPFSGVNESTFEHMKLLFWPMLLFAGVQRLFFSERADFWCVKLRGICFGLLLIPVLFYTYNGVIGPSPDAVNIGIFFVCAALAYRLEAHLFSQNNTYRTCRLSLLILLLLALLFCVFIYPPHH